MENFQVISFVTFSSIYYFLPFSDFLASKALNDDSFSSMDLAYACPFSTNNSPLNFSPIPSKKELPDFKKFKNSPRPFVSKGIENFSPRLMMKRNISSSYVGLRHKSPYAKRAVGTCLSRSPSSSFRNSTRSPRPSVPKRAASKLLEGKENLRPNKMLNEEGKKKKLMEIARSIELQTCWLGERLETQGNFDSFWFRDSGTKEESLFEFNMDSAYKGERQTSGRSPCKPIEKSRSPLRQTNNSGKRERSKRSPLRTKGNFLVVS